ncbi:MAG: helicase HerA-like domain-containing protein, partial [Nitrosospira sp.]
RAAIIKSSVIFGHYEQVVDRESAYEIIKSRTAVKQEPESTAAPQDGGAAQNAQAGGMMDMLGDMLLSKTGPRGGHHPGLLDSVAKSAARSIGSQVGREIFRGVLGGIFGGGRRR